MTVAISDFFTGNSSSSNRSVEAKSSPPTVPQRRKPESECTKDPGMSGAGRMEGIASFFCEVKKPILSTQSQPGDKSKECTENLGLLSYDSEDIDFEDDEACASQHAKTDPEVESVLKDHLASVVEHDQADGIAIVHGQVPSTDPSLHVDCVDIHDSCDQHSAEYEDPDADVQEQCNYSTVDDAQRTADNINEGINFESQTQSLADSNAQQLPSKIDNSSMVEIQSVSMKVQSAKSQDLLSPELDHLGADAKLNAGAAVSSTAAVVEDENATSVFMARFHGGGALHNGPKAKSRKPRDARSNKSSSTKDRGCLQKDGADTQKQACTHSGAATGGDLKRNLDVTSCSTKDTESNGIVIVEDEQATNAFMARFNSSGIAEPDKGKKSSSAEHTEKGRRRQGESSSSKSKVKLKNKENKEKIVLFSDTQLIQDAILSWDLANDDEHYCKVGKKKVCNCGTLTSSDLKYTRKDGMGIWARPLKMHMTTPAHKNTQITLVHSKQPSIFKFVIEDELTAEEKAAAARDKLESDRALSNQVNSAFSKGRQVHKFFETQPKRTVSGTGTRDSDEAFGTPVYDLEDGSDEQPIIVNSSSCDAVKVQEPSGNQIQLPQPKVINFSHAVGETCAPWPGFGYRHSNPWSAFTNAENKRIKSLSGPKTCHDLSLTDSKLPTEWLANCSIRQVTMGLPVELTDGHNLQTIALSLAGRSMTDDYQRDCFFALPDLSSREVCRNMEKEVWCESARPEVMKLSTGGDSACQLFWALKEFVERIQNPGKKNKKPRRRVRGSTGQEALHNINTGEAAGRQLVRDNKLRLVLQGPPGTSKTASIYAACNEMGIMVREAHPGHKRSGKCLSELVANVDNGATHFGGDNGRYLGPAIVIDAADIVFEDDSGFHSAVVKMLESTKRPVFITCNELTPFLSSLGLPILTFSPADVFHSIAVALCLNSVCKGHLGAPASSMTTPVDISRVLLQAHCHHGDIRRTVSQEQLESRPFHGHEKRDVPDIPGKSCSPVKRRGSRAQKSPAKEFGRNRKRLLDDEDGQALPSSNSFTQHSNTSTVGPNTSSCQKETENSHSSGSKRAFTFVDLDDSGDFASPPHGSHAELQSPTKACESHMGLPEAQGQGKLPHLAILLSYYCLTHSKHTWEDAAVSYIDVWPSIKRRCVESVSTIFRGDEFGCDSVGHQWLGCIGLHQINAHAATRCAVDLVGAPFSEFMAKEAAFCEDLSDVDVIGSVFDAEDSGIDAGVGQLIEHAICSLSLAQRMRQNGALKTVEELDASSCSLQMPSTAQIIANDLACLSSGADKCPASQMDTARGEAFDNIQTFLSRKPLRNWYGGGKDSSEMVHPFLRRMAASKREHVPHKLGRQKQILKWMDEETLGCLLGSNSLTAWKNISLAKAVRSEVRKEVERREQVQSVLNNIVQDVYLQAIEEPLHSPEANDADRAGCGTEQPDLEIDMEQA